MQKTKKSEYFTKRTWRPGGAGLPALQVSLCAAILLSFLIVLLALGCSISEVSAASGNRTTTYTIKNEASYSLKFIKKDQNTGKTLSGGTFELYSVNSSGSTGSKVAAASADSGGVISFTGLSKGTYRLKETAAPSGYLLSSKTWDAETGTEKAISGYEVMNAPGELRFHKTDSVTGEDITGGTFSLLNSSGTAVKTGLKPDSDGEIVISGLSAGTYTLKETAAPAGYMLNTSGWKVTLSESTAGNVTEITNTPYGTLKFVKKDGDSGETLSGGVFRLRKGHGTSGVIAAENLTPDPAGEFQVNNVPPGDYHLEEVTAPYGYAKNEDGWDVSAEAGVTSLRNIDNYKLLDLRIQKTSSTSGYQILSGGSFELTDSDGNKTGDEISLGQTVTVNADGTTSISENDNGTLEFKNLPQGTYHLKEVTAPYGCEKNSAGWDFDVTSGEAVDGAVSKTIQNETEDIELNLKKADSDTGNGISSGTFQLKASRDSQTVISEGAAGEDGIIHLGVIPDGTYFLEEVTAPTGYRVNQLGWVVTVAGEKVTITDFSG